MRLGSRIPAWKTILRSRELWATDEHRSTPITQEVLSAFICVHRWPISLSLGDTGLRRSFGAGLTCSARMSKKGHGSPSAETRASRRSKFPFVRHRPDVLRAVPIGMSRGLGYSIVIALLCRTPVDLAGFGGVGFPTQIGRESCRERV